MILALTVSQVWALQITITPPDDFNEAKRIATKLYADHAQTFYCGCQYSGKTVDLRSCGYQVRKQAKRAARIEWEHIVPAWVIGHQRQCWQNGGRKNCTSNDPIFSAAEADLHNLVPAIGEVNGDRSNYALGMLTDKPTQYGACPMVVSFKEDKAMPPENVRGAAARIYLYMTDHYKLRLSSQDRKTYEAWNRMYPVSEWELWRNQAIACEMGWGNDFVGKVDLSQCGNNTRQPVTGQTLTKSSKSPAATEFNCATRKTCGTMRSCAEATYHLSQCGNSRLDRDGDGTPCESLCR